MNIEGKKLQKATIVSRREIAQDTVELVLDLGADRFDFIAGQYIWLILPRLIFPDPKGRRRAFSIASPPQDKPLTIVFRTSESGWKRTVMELPIGSKVELVGPFGFFTLQEGEEPVVMLAGGTGVTPFLSIVGDIVKRQTLRQINIFVSNSTKERVFYRDKIEGFAKENSHIKVYQGESRLTWEDVKRRAANVDTVLWYIAGPQDMVEGVTAILLEHGVSEENIRFDQFYGIVPKLSPEAHPPSELERFRLAVEQSTDHLVITDTNGRIQYANHAAEEITGYKNEELIDQTPRLWGGLMGREFYTQLWRTIKYEKKPFISEIVNRKKSGEMYTSEMHIVPILAKNQTLIGFVASEKDITKVREAEQALKRSEERFRSIIQNSYDAIALLDEHSITTYISPSIQKILGYAPEELVGKSGFITIYPEDMEKAHSIFADLLHKLGIGIKAEIRVLHKNGKIVWVRATAVNLLEEQAVRSIIINFSDITAEKQLDQAKTEFISITSHQLRTPISAIKWYAEMLKAGDAGALNETQMKYLDEVYDANQRMIDLVNLLLDVSRVEMGKLPMTPEPVNLPKFTGEIVKEMEEGITKKHLVVDMSFEPNFPDIVTDKKFMRIILENLISNAVKYTPERGKVTVRIDQKDHNISIFVADSGIGIPKADQANVFTKSFRSNNAKLADPYGTGVGLYLTKSIVNQLNGRIWFTSEEGKGTTFEVIFPF